MSYYSTGSTLLEGAKAGDGRHNNGQRRQRERVTCPDDEHANTVLGVKPLYSFAFV